MNEQNSKNQARCDEAIALLKILSFSVDDMNNGRVVSSSALKKRLAKRRLKASTHQ